MKNCASIVPLLLFLLFTACSTAGAGKAPPSEVPPPESGITLDAAIEELGAYFARSLAPNSVIALINIDTDKPVLSDYIFEELWVYFEDHASFTFVERQKLELIHKEMAYQLSGQVRDDLAKSIGQQFGPQTLVYGKFSRLGAEYRLTMYATDVERATSVMRSATFKADRRLAALLENPDTGRAGIDMANVLYAGTDNTFKFTVQTDKPGGDYREGDDMTMRIYSEKDAWFKVTHVDANGNAQVIYPKSAGDNNFIKAGQTRQIPDNSRFHIGKPYGQEIILASAYTEAFTVERPANAAPLSNNMVARGLVVKNAGTRISMNPVVTAQFSFTVRP